VALGATEFHYGLENDFGGVWLNTFTGGWRRLGYYALKQAYTGQASANTPPEITSMTVSSPTSVPAGSQFTVNVAASDPNGDPIRYNLMVSDKHITGGTGFSNVTFTQTGNGQFSVTAPQRMGVWKVYVYAFDGQGNVGIEQKSFRVV
jgi:nitrogen fixation protein FixH